MFRSIKRLSTYMTYLAVAILVNSYISVCFSKDEPDELKIVSSSPKYFASEFSRKIFPPWRSTAYVEDSYLKLIRPTNSHHVKTLFDRSSSIDLLPGEFYTFVKMDNYFKDDDIYTACDNNGRHFAIAVSVYIDYQGLKGSLPVIFVPKSVILSDNNRISNNLPRNGCEFKSTKISQTGPYVLSSNFGRGQGEYTLHFDTATGTSSRASSLAMFAKAALAVVGALPGFTLPPGVTAGIPIVTGTLDTLIDRAGGFVVDAQYSAVLTATRPASIENGEVTEYQKGKPFKQVTGFYLRITSPFVDQHNSRGSDEIKNKGAGVLEIYQGRSASIIIDNSNSRDISVTFTQAKSELMTEIGKLGPNVTTGLEAAWSNIFSGCRKIQDTASELGLSPIDALLVRWALLQDVGLFDTLIAYYDEQNPAHEKVMKAYDGAITAAARLGNAKPITYCWTQTDTKRLDAVGMIMDRNFVPRAQ
jgi:hypothetical protein